MVLMMGQRRPSASHLKINLFIVAIDSGQGIGTIHFEGFVEGGTEIFNRLFPSCPLGVHTRDFQAPSNPPWPIPLNGSSVIGLHIEDTSFNE
jgi:hypothetical protein